MGQPSEMAACLLGRTIRPRSTALLALLTHGSSSISDIISFDEKYFTQFLGPPPSGFSSPTRTNIGISCDLKPSSTAASSETRRAGNRRATKAQCGCRSFVLAFTLWQNFHLRAQRCKRFPRHRRRAPASLEHLF